MPTTNKSSYSNIAHNSNIQFAQNMAVQQEYFAGYFIYIYIYFFPLKELYARVHAKKFKAVTQHEQSVGLFTNYQTHSIQRH